MQGFEWAEENLRVRTPYDLESRDVTIFWAPHISADVKVIDLADGRVRSFSNDEKRPTAGYFAELESMEKYCRANGSAFQESDGAVSLVPAEAD